ncbi:DNA helicase (plasmid) [Rhizobium ruizarguesonis]|uniref:3'-5' exonuclease n=1 Tax=Rhizobium ruizarguesonis TaxID=2081791 RepID=UPI0010312B51|nr:3'-5' exonuclease [Rhizobium ruizarguesonis]TBB60050.1 DNA helicase [Rhizobium ruizarguesonis]
MNRNSDIRVSYDLGCLTSIRRLPDRVSAKFMDMMLKFMSDPTAHGLNFETVKGARDRGLKSVRVDQSYRAIAFQSGSDVMFVHVNEHDPAYEWASRRTIKVDPSTNRIRIVEEIPTDQSEVTVTPEYGAPELFAQITDARLLSLGVLAEELPRVREIRSVEDLDASSDSLDGTTHNILVAIESGFSDEEIRELVGLDGEKDVSSGAAPQPSFSEVLGSPESRQRIFIPENEEELRRFFEGDLAGWRVFLHPAQRKIAYRDYSGPALVRGGAGTGKTVVAMHHAKYLADHIKADPARKGQRVLFTTFTTSLAHDIAANLQTLCPEHLSKDDLRIEVINLDRWVHEFLKRKNYPRTIVYFGAEADRLNEIWREVLDDIGTPVGLSEEFIRAEWTQVVQAKGILSDRDYFRAPRNGRGTPLDRKKRIELWAIFDAYRARMLNEKLAEPDDAYREAISILTAAAASLPYCSVIVDEAQDMGEQAFRLIRAIVEPKSTGDSNSIFVVGDAHQRIYNRKASMKACGIDVRGRSRKLKLNYRTSEEIRRWAVSTLQGVSVDDLDEGSDSLIGYKSLFHGPAPDLKACASESDELREIVDWVQQLNTNNFPLAEIGILASTNDQLAQVEKAIMEAGLAYLRLKANEADDRSVDGVRLCTMHRAKGLEFRAVYIPFLSASKFPPKFIMDKSVDGIDRKEMENRFRSLLHVAATRAKQELKISWSGTRTTLLT